MPSVGCAIFSRVSEPTPPIGADVVIPPPGSRLAAGLRLAVLRTRFRKSLGVGRGVHVAAGARIRIRNGGVVALGDGVLLGLGCRIEADGGGVTIGEGARLGARSVVVALAGVGIGAQAVVGDWAMVTDAEQSADDVETPIRRQPVVPRAVRIGASTSGAVCSASVTIAQSPTTACAPIATPASAAITERAPSRAPSPIVTPPPSASIRQPGPSRTPSPRTTTPPLAIKIRAPGATWTSRPTPRLLRNRMRSTARRRRAASFEPGGGMTTSAPIGVGSDTWLTMPYGLKLRRVRADHREVSLSHRIVPPAVVAALCVALLPAAREPIRPATRRRLRAHRVSHVRLRQPPAAKLAARRSAKADRSKQTHRTSAGDILRWCSFLINIYR